MENYIPRLQKQYQDSIRKELMEEFGYKSIMEVPRLQKICMNQGVNGATQDKKLVDIAVEEMSRIAGQRAVATLAKKSVSNFKLREGMPIGAKVTLRAAKMYEFLDRLISVSMPRIRDFNGINNKGFDGRGNYNLGIKEHIIFPEIDLDKINKIMGMDVTFVTTAKTDKEAMALLTKLGMPFKK